MSCDLTLRKVEWIKFLLCFCPFFGYALETLHSSTLILAFHFWSAPFRDKKLYEGIWLFTLNLFIGVNYMVYHNTILTFIMDFFFLSGFINYFSLQTIVGFCSKWQYFPKKRRERMESSLTLFLLYYNSFLGFFFRIL